MPAYEIVQLEPDEWQAYKHIRLDALRTEPQAFGSTYADNLQHPESFWRGRLAEAALGQRSWLLFARHQDRLVGIIGAYVAQENTEVAEIISMYVAPDFRRQGIARALMIALLPKIHQNSAITSLRLGVNIGQEPAIRLYRAFGFAEVSTVSGLMGDGQHYDSLVMEKPLE